MRAPGNLAQGDRRLPPQLRRRTDHLPRFAPLSPLSIMEKLGNAPNAEKMGASRGGGGGSGPSLLISGVSHTDRLETRGAGGAVLLHF